MLAYAPPLISFLAYCSYRTVISDITAKMGAGMASYILASSNNSLTVQTWGDYDLYCHFVAGLVGEGLSRLFSSSGIERDWLGDQLSLSNHMGLFLQKTNIIRDYAEDCVDGRHFWPAACYKARGFEAQPDVARGIIAKGGNHFRYWIQDGSQANRSVISPLRCNYVLTSASGAYFMATSYELPIQSKLLLFLPPVHETNPHSSGS